MSRLTLGNIFKVSVALFFFPFVPLLVLMIGVRRKNGKVILEGAVYVALVLAAAAVAGYSALAVLSFFVMLGVVAVSAMRSYMLRDLWLHPRGRGPQVMTQPPTHVRQAGDPASTGASNTTEDLSSALAWSASLARQNKNRLPAVAYVSILETCQTLDAVIDAETRQPLGDPQFEYELSATVREYLPSVLRSYVAIPPKMLETKQASGRTPNEELVEQLQLLAGQAETLHASRHRRTSAELTNTGIFLRERFGHRQGGFDFGIR
ncbi:hypothetical protein N2K95_01455 [Arthrobacter zhaoxinii]|uniref:DUF2254 domain-containing protein n=1 Tax=Arthrobacter zhaoxinii TaxID=2964616 RepID=A0ABY5YQM8_9MICC|nr:hypothetical protein [Arthrobacter zhaoxinii]UWX97390.1 hypothetical protein N2K95_01455 [Arthrobacter zhaoxinii]